jgi:integrase
MANNETLTEKTYSSIFSTYLDTVPKEKMLTQEGFQFFLDELKKKGFKTTTIRLYYFAMKTVFDQNEVDISDIEIPEIDESEVERPRYTKEEIIKLIGKAKSLSGVYAKTVAISTIYGVRRVELQMHNPNDINIKNKTIFIRTGKGGRKVHHLIPDNLIPFMTAEKLPSAWSLSRMFNVVATSAGIKSTGIGWHGIRRTLIDELSFNGADDGAINLFMRWKTGTMLDIYRRKTPAQDLRIFERHPFIEYW